MLICFFKGTDNVIWGTSGRNCSGAVKANQNKIYIASFIFPSLRLTFSLNYSSLTFPLQTSQSFDFPLTTFFKWPNDKKVSRIFPPSPFDFINGKSYTLN